MTQADYDAIVQSRQAALPHMLEAHRREVNQKNARAKVK
jgi:hypothetical protein